MDERDRRLLEILQDIFDNETLMVGRTDDIKEIDGWDSLLHISIMAAIQDEFGINFSIDEITGLDTMEKIISAVERKK